MGIAGFLAPRCLLVEEEGEGACQQPWAAADKEMASQVPWPPIQVAPFPQQEKITSLARRPLSRQ